MASFTISLQEVWDDANGDWRAIGLDSYPIFSEDYREYLNNRILEYYWMREIAHETVPIFAWAMRRRMNMGMPLYNQLYKSTQLEFDPLTTIDIRTVVGSSSTSVENTSRDSSGSASSASETLSENEALSRTVSSETPQTMLSGDGDYATSAVDATSRAKTEGTGSESQESESAENTETEATGETESDSHTRGYQGLPSDMLMRWRESMINVDRQVILDLSPCFFQIANTEDHFI